MLNPSELEGEVDHSFFDSDCDISSVGGDGRNMIEKYLNDENDHQPVHEHLYGNQPDDIQGGVSPRTEGATRQLKPQIRLYHSALNRKREQQRIERENLAFLKRLESVKPTPGLKRSQQLADYQRQAGYLRGPCYPDFTSRMMKERSACNTPSAPAGPRSATSAHRSSRPVSVPDDSRPRTKSNKPSSARPAWS